MFSIYCRKKFKAFHSVMSENGVYEKPHEHEWLIECKIASEKLNESGFVADFTIIDRYLSEIISILENSNLNDVLSPKYASAENLAFYVFSKLESLIKSMGLRLKKVKTWEDESHGASYKS